MQATATTPSNLRVLETVMFQKAVAGHPVELKFSQEYAVGFLNRLRAVDEFLGGATDLSASLEREEHQSDKSDIGTTPRSGVSRFLASMKRSRSWSQDRPDEDL